jgi:dTMP kinase
MTKIKSKFITFEGGEGAGKTTQIKLLRDYLESKNISTLITREPGGTPGGEDIRKLLKEGEKSKWDGISEALLLYAARHDHVEKIIKPALKEGKWVLCDRFSDSSLVYQGIARNLGVEKILELHNWALGPFQPDITFIFDIPPKLSQFRQKSRNTSTNVKDDRFEQMNLDFHNQVYAGYLKLIELFPDRCVLVDATKNIEKVHSSIVLHLQ